MAGKLSYGEEAGRIASGRAGGPAATTAAITAIPPVARVDGMICTVATQAWVFVAGSTSTSGPWCLQPDDNTTNAGRWKPTQAAVLASGTSGQTVVTNVSGLVIGTGLSCVINAAGHLVIWHP